jgi:hypothetical protein
MSSADNESVVREWFRRVWNQLDANAIDELFAPDGVAHWLDAEPVRGPAAFREFHRVLSSSFRDIHVEVVPGNTGRRFGCVPGRGATCAG